MSINPLESSVPWTAVIADIRLIENDIEKKATNIQDPLLRDRYLLDSGLATLQTIRGQLHDSFLPTVEEQRRLFQKVDAIRDTWAKTFAKYREYDQATTREQIRLALERQNLEQGHLNDAKFLAVLSGGVTGVAVGAHVRDQIKITLKARGIRLPHHSELTENEVLLCGVAGAYVGKCAVEGAHRGVGQIKRALQEKDPSAPKPEPDHGGKQ